jgi:nicotinamidase-related amidase
MFMPLLGMPLPVRNADNDMLKLALFVLLNLLRYDAIVVTLDTHSDERTGQRAEGHISHPERWINSAGQHPAPFTVITSKDYEAGIWKATLPSDQAWQGEYLRRLEATGRIHTIWTVHGRENEFEYEVYAPLKEALTRWEKATGKKVWYVKKGRHRDTEQLGIFAANVPIDNAPETKFNVDLAVYIDGFDEVDIAGEAASHCVMDSTNQYLAYVPASSYGKIRLFRDAMSPVDAVVDPQTGKVVVDFPALTEAWFSDLVKKGVRVETLQPKFTVLQ